MRGVGWSVAAGRRAGRRVRGRRRGSASRSCARAARHRRALEERGWLLERERESAARTAVDAERARIARELHDIVSHNVSLMIVQAGAAREVLDDDAGRGRGGAVGRRGRRPRHDDRAAAPARPAGARGRRHGRPASDAGGLAPQPSLSRLSPLVDRIAFAGLPVEVRISGEPRPLPSGIDVTAYRIVQEALTNALKHGDGGKAEVTVRYADHALRVEVLNSGPSVLTGDRPGAAATGPATAPGRGLLGLRRAGRGLRRRPRRPAAARRRLPGPGPHPAGPAVTAGPAPRVLIADDQDADPHRLPADPHRPAASTWSARPPTASRRWRPARGCAPTSC